MKKMQLGPFYATYVKKGLCLKATGKEINDVECPRHSVVDNETLLEMTE